MLKNMSIKGFKTISDLHIEFGRINLFIGANGTGKSNILEAIGLLSACFSRSISPDDLIKKGVRLSVPTLFKSAFKNAELRKTFDLSSSICDGLTYKSSITAGEESESLAFFSEKLISDGKKIFGRSGHGISLNLRNVQLDRTEVPKNRSVWDQFGPLLDINKKHRDELERLKSYAIYSPQTAFLRGVDSESTKITPLGLNGGGLAQAASTVFNLLKETKKIDHEKHEIMQDVTKVLWATKWTDRILVDNYNPEKVSSEVKNKQVLYFKDIFMNQKRNMLSAYDSSEGTLYILFLIVLMLHPESPKIFSIDNVDNSLNPSITTKIISHLIEVVCSNRHKEINIGPDQVFLTSHNPASLDSFDIFDENQRIFVVKRNENGATTVKRLEPPSGVDKATWINASGGKNLSELFMSGRISGALGL